MLFSDLQTLVRDYIGEDSAGNWSDAQVKRAINRSAKEVYNQIVGMNEGFFGTVTTIDWVSGTELYTIRSGGIQRLLLTEYVNGTHKQALRKVPVQDKELYQDATGLRNAAGFFYVFGNQIGFKPTPTVTRTAAVNVFGVSPLADLVNAGHALPLEWTDQQHEVVALGACVRLAMRSKELIAVYQPNFDRLWKGMIDDMQIRDGQEIKTIRPGDLLEEC